MSSGVLATEGVRGRARADRDGGRRGPARGGARLRSWLHALFGPAYDGVAVSGAGRILYVNPRLEALLGRGGELVGGPSLALYPESEWPQVLMRTQTMAFTGRPSPPGRQRVLGGDGRCVALEVAALLLERADGSLLIETLRPPRDPRIPASGLASAQAPLRASEIA